MEMVVHQHALFNLVIGVPMYHLPVQKQCVGMD